MTATSAVVNGAAGKTNGACLFHNICEAAGWRAEGLETLHYLGGGGYWEWFGLRHEETCDLLTTRPGGQRPDSALYWHHANLRFAQIRVWHLRYEHQKRSEVFPAFSDLGLGFIDVIEIRKEIRVRRAMWALSDCYWETAKHLFCRFREFIINCDVSASWWIWFSDSLRSDKLHEEL